ncbi:reverse transcriptase domain-containing protein [Tanacetum coccineum]|uniref:Reverse transcriptase domain-containing protein n=1 Tax=Tanacetum coccineum TaxID=301880 RepID=A0ABQ5DUK6_9ASTR
MTATVTSSIHATRALVPSHVDLLPPRKRFRDSISLEDSVEEDINMDVLEDIKANATADEVVVDRDVEVEVDVGIGMEVNVGVDVEDEVEDEVESSDRVYIWRLDGCCARILRWINSVQSPWGLIAGGEIVAFLSSCILKRSNARMRHMMIGEQEADRFLCRNMTITHSGMTPEAIEELVNRRVEEALASYEATRAANALEAESQSQNGSDDDNGNGGNGNGGNGNCGDGNSGNGNGGNENLNENNRDARLVARECTYQDFMKCQPLNFKGTEGVNLHKRTIGTDVAFSMSWRDLMKLMAEVYCPRIKIQKMESELWNLTMKNNDLAVYTQRFQELTRMCTKMVPKEEDRVKKIIRGLPDNIQGNVIDAEPTRLQDAVQIANNLMDQKLKGYAMKNVENKRKFDNRLKYNGGRNHPNKRQNFGGHNVARAYTAGNNKRRVYNGPLPLCNKCHNLHYFNSEGSSSESDFECGGQGHYRSDCPKFKDQNCGNKAGNKNGIGKAKGKAYVLGGGDANPDSNVVKGMFLLNNHYAFILFDSGADRSFVSTTFSTLLDITPDTLDVSYAVELADGRISETNTVLRGCTLGLLGHPFNIDLMPVELGSFDAIIGMDWLANHHAVIVCDEKVVRIPYGDEVLIVQGDGGSRREKSKLSIISCTKTHKYVERGCLIFLAQVTKKETRDKSEEKRLEDVPTVRDFCCGITV